MASGAEVAVTKLFYALGYHVPENYIAKLTRDMLVIDDRSTITAADGGERHLTDGDVDKLLKMAAQESDGSYRVIASKAVSGKPIGPFLYAGTRSDDPNDIVPHEHRRELRALRVFAAWTNHVDSKSINSLDTLSPKAGVRGAAYLIDFGSTLAAPQSKPEFDEGHQYIFEPGPTAAGIVSLGFTSRRFTSSTIPTFRRSAISRRNIRHAELETRVPIPRFVEPAGRHLLGCTAG